MWAGHLSCVFGASCWRSRVLVGSACSMTELELCHITSKRSPKARRPDRACATGQVASPLKKGLLLLEVLFDYCLSLIMHQRHSAYGSDTCTSYHRTPVSSDICKPTKTLTSGVKQLTRSQRLYATHVAHSWPADCPLVDENSLWWTQLCFHISHL